MKRKLISMICALSMIFSVVSGMSMISAQANDDIYVKATGSVVDGKASIDVIYSGIANIASAEFSLPLDETIFDVTNVEFVKPAAFAAMTTNFDTAVGAAKISWYSTDPVAATGENTLVTITVPVKEGITYPVTLNLEQVKIEDDEYNSYGNKSTVDTQVTVTGATIEEPTGTPTAEPATATPGPATATPGVVRPTIDPSSRPTKAPVPTEAPTAGPATATPTAKPAQYVEAVGNVVDGKLSVDVVYNGLESIASAEFSLPLDETIFDVTNVEFTKPAAFAAMTTNFDTAVGAAKISWYSTDPVAATGENTLVTITVPVKEGITYPVTLNLEQVKIEDDEYNSYGNKSTVDTQIPVLAATVTDPSAVPTPVETATPTPTVAPADTTSAVKDVVGSENSASIKDAYAADNTVEIGLNVTFKDADGKVVNAVYGTDFVVVDADGNALSEDAYNNIINGYDTEGLISLIDGNAKFYFYNDKIVSAETDVIDYTNNDYIGDRYTETIVDVPNDDDNKDNGKWTWKSATSVRVDKSITLDAVYTDGNGVEHDGDEIEYSFKSGSKSSYATLKDDVLTGDKKGSVQIVATYVDDTTKTSQRTIRITDTTSTSNNGGTTGSTGAGGDIAQGNNSNVPTINNNVYFTDIWSVPWAQEAIYGLASKNIINGRSATEFDPEANVTRAEFAKMLVSTFGFTNFAGASSNFADVPTSHWAYNFVSIAAQIGAVTGYDATTFGPNDYITREDMAVMIYRVVTGHNVNMPYVEEAITFTDDADIYGYAKDAVTALQRADVINGMGDGTFAPKANATRAQAAVMLYNFVK